MTNPKECSKIVVVGVFAEDYLVKIASDVVKNAARDYVNDVQVDVLTWGRNEKDFKSSNGRDEAKNLFEKVEHDQEIILWDTYRILPFFVCETADDFRKCGLKCPYEFVIERKDLFEGKGLRATELLRQRIAILQAQEQSKDGIDLEIFKDWISGVMRRYMFLDETAHGISGLINQKDPNWEWENWFNSGKNKDLTKWKKRFADGETDTNDEFACLKPLMKAVWPQYFSDGELSLATLPTSIDDSTKEQLNKVYNIGKSRDKFPPSDRLPLSDGDMARFVTPTGKINILLIDDDANESVLLDSETYKHLDSHKVGETTEQSNNDDKWKTAPRVAECGRIDEEDKKSDYAKSWRRFDEIFSVHPVNLIPEDFPRFEAWLNEILKQHLSYDFALVDLCFGEDPGCDSLGYHVIKKLAKLFPHMPIVVYSRYKDMGHILRAFQCGAMWFLQKGEEQKLARHLLDLVKKGSWKREWRAMQDFHPVEFIYTGKDQAFDDKFRHTEGWQYLTAKSLEFFPGKFIEVKKMGGGISTASTFSVQKGLKLDGVPLQSPMIIKIDTTPNTRMEYQRYFRYIRPYMANEAGRIERPSVIIDRNCSAIVYTFAGRQDKAHTLDSMKNMLKADVVFKASCDYEKYRKAFDMIFDEILPRIHRVTPNREFGDGEKNRHQEVFSKPEALDAQEAEGASFPNLQFGEVEEKDFYQTYLIRYPHFGKKILTNDAFVSQPTFEIKQVNEKSKEKAIEIKKASEVHPYEYHDICEKDDGNIELEVYDCEHDRKPYLLIGPVATHVARFRRQLHPGTVLWVKGESDDREQTREMLFDGRIGNVAENEKWKEYVGKFTKTSLKGCAGWEFFDLTDRVLHFCKALFDNEHREYENFILESGGLFNIGEVQKFFEHIKERFKCPIAICHGDLNYGNIMLESRKHQPKDETPDVNQTITDVWLIDFARTRRDMIAHDFNVMFTDTFALLFSDKIKRSAEDDEKLDEILYEFICNVMFEENSEPPDFIADDKRLSFVYKILRRIRKAALDSDISKEMYTLTTVLECLMALKLHLKKSMKNIRASAALFAVSKICFEHLCKELEIDLLQEGWETKKD